MSHELASGDFAAMWHAASVCVLLHDAETKAILWANPAACRMLEFSLTELKPLKAPDMTSPSSQYDRTIGLAWLQAAVDQGSSVIEWHYRSRSGRVIPTEATATRVGLARGPAVMVQFRDIQHELSVQRELEVINSYVLAIGQQTSANIMILSRDGDIEYATDAGLRSLAIEPGEQPGALAAHVSQHGAPLDWARLRSTASPVASVQLEVTSGDRPAWLEGSLEQLKGHAEGGFIMMLHDVSDRVDADAQKERELYRENYLARYTAMGDIAMAIAHELGQPLAAAANYLGAIERSADWGAGNEGTGIAVEQARRQVDRAAAVVNSVRSFVGHQQQETQHVDLNDLVEECLYFVRLRSQSAAVEVLVDRSSSPVPVLCERVLVGQVILNLCFNALDELAASGSPGTIIVTARRAKGTGVVTVSDSGNGIDFDPFEESSMFRPRGAGIGLALSQRIISRHGGTIWAERLPAGGSEFGFALALAEGGVSR